ncbi:hypothetical protein [Actinoplanes sp. NPDC026670]|uniref:hypothetical protein n=1 Tax=Actinoplanes sp. NPDC026670 TaxID=3154700 RepID=UPI0033FD74C9
MSVNVMVGNGFPVGGVPAGVVDSVVGTGAGGDEGAADGTGALLVVLDEEGVAGEPELFAQPAMIAPAATARPIRNVA